MQAVAARIAHCDLIVPIHDDGQLDFANGFQILDIRNENDDAFCSHLVIIDSVDLYEGLHYRTLRLLRSVENNRDIRIGDYTIAIKDFNDHRFELMDVITYVEAEVAIFNRRSYHYLHTLYQDMDAGRRFVFRPVDG